MESKYWSMFCRNIGTYTIEEQEKLKNSTVLVAGTGGLGSPTAIALARLGIGRLILADIDVYEMSNLNRQLPSRYEDVGKEKVQVIAKHIQDINPSIELEVIQDGIHEKNADRLVKKCDIVVNAMDTYASITLQKSLKKYKKLALMGNIIQQKVMASVIGPEGPFLCDIYPFEIDEKNKEKTTAEFKQFLMAMLKKKALFEGGFVSVTSPGTLIAGGIFAFQVADYIAKNELTIPPFPSHLIFDGKTMTCRHKMKYMNLLRKNPYSNRVFKKLFNVIAKQRLGHLHNIKQNSAINT